MQGASLMLCQLQMADLTGADLTGANLAGAMLGGANLTKAILQKCNLSNVSLVGADLAGANLAGADLTATVLVGANLLQADLTGSRIYGVSAWDVCLDSTIQEDLIITTPAQAKVTVSNLEVAQFIYLPLHNQKIRDVIDTVTYKVVLILGRFTEELKELASLCLARRAQGATSASLVD